MEGGEGGESGEREGKRWVLWDGEAFCGGGGRAATIMGWRGLPRPEGGRWVAGSIMGWQALLPPGEYYGMRMPHKARGGGGGEAGGYYGMAGPAAARREGRSIMGWHHSQRV